VEKGNLAPLSFPIPLAAAISSGKVKSIDNAKGTGDLTAGSSTVDNLTITKGIFDVGSPISGTGIPAGTTITAKTETTLTLSAPATATGTGVTLTEGVRAECDNEEGTAPAFTNPEADPGFLCVFVSGSAPAPFGASPNTKAGSVLLWTTEVDAIGTFAVTAP
jgi:hypothetical protein